MRQTGNRAPQLIHRAAWQRLRLDTHCAHYFATAQALPGAGFIFHPQVETNRSLTERWPAPAAASRQTVGVHRQRQQQRRRAGLFIAQPLFLQQFNWRNRASSFYPCSVGRGGTVRTSSGWPNIFSNCLIRCETADWVIHSFCAARSNPRSLITASSACSVL